MISRIRLTPYLHSSRDRRVMPAGLNQICNHREQAQHALTEPTLEEMITDLHAGRHDLADR